MRDRTTAHTLTTFGRVLTITSGTTSMNRLLAVVAASALLVMACTSSDDGTAEGDAAATTDVAAGLDVAATLSDAAAVTSGRLQGKATAGGFDAAAPDTTAELTFTGAFDDGADATQISADVAPLFEAGVVTGDIGGLPANLIGGAFTEPIELVVIGPDGFVRAGILDLVTGQPGAWAQLERDQLEDFIGSFGLGFDVTDPNRPLAWLAAGDAGDTVELVGEESVGGTAAEHWRATIDLSPARASLAADDQDSFDAVFGTATEVEVDLWVATDDGRLLRYDLPLATGTGLGDDATLELSVEIADHGSDVGIASPPADQVVDGSALFALIGGE